MPQVFSIARALGPIDGDNTIEELYRQLAGVMIGFDGLISMTVWQAQSNPTEYLVVNHYATEKAAIAGFDELAQSDFFDKVAEQFDAPLDIQRAVVSYAYGLPPGDSPVGTYLSLSNRSADPGHGVQLEAELWRIFGELTVIDGFRGALIGHGMQLAEEAYGLALWDTVESFMESLPKKVLYEVRLFERIR